MMTSPMGDTTDRFVRLWVVVEEDRGEGAHVCSIHASEDEANKWSSGHTFVDYADIPWSRLETLKPNAERQGRGEAAYPERSCSQSGSVD